MARALDPSAILADWLLSNPYGDTTREDYEREVTDLINAFGPAKVWDLTSDDIRTWTKTPDRPRTEAWRISVLRGFYRHARKIEPTIGNPVPRGLRPAVDGLPRGRPALTRAESTYFVAALDAYVRHPDALLPHRARALGYLVLGMGLRAHQAVALNLDGHWIREQHRTTLRATLKGGGLSGPREVPPAVAHAVEDYLLHRRTAAPYSRPDAGPLLTSGRGRRLDSYNSPRDLLRAIASTHPQLAHLTETLTADGLANSPNPFLG
ncbi:hypothetical protein [Kitasatospora sp. NPDC094016]|uniref:hypothetical protein n=1 Tax=Kitasatospora sp. NPDC094016 TaxID=3154986 RepID=UPI0033213518